MIIRIANRKRYTIISNGLLEDSRLSWDAKGLLCYLLGKPDDWQVMREQLAEAGPDGVYVIRRLLQELERTGYLRRERHQTAIGTFVWVHNIYEEPVAEEPVAENPPVGDSPLLNTDVPKTELPKKGEGSAPAAPPSVNGNHKAEVTPESLMADWNSYFADSAVPHVREMSPARRKKAIARIREHPTEAFWQEVYDAIAASPFLRGENMRGWRASFDFIIENPENVLKITEGFYAAEKTQQRQR